MSAIIQSARTVEPIEILKEAVEAAREQGIRVRVGSAGVMPVGTHGSPRWGLDQLERDTGIDPLGAVLLYSQPPSVDPEQAVALAIGVDRCWIDAFADGLALNPKDSRWLASPARQNYLHGYESGANFRIWLKSFPELAS